MPGQPLTRSVCATIATAVTAALLLALIETLWMWASARPALLVAGGTPYVALPLAGLMVGLGVLIGLVEGVVVGVVVARLRSAHARAMAYSVVAGPAIIWLVHSAFAGRRMQALSGRVWFEITAGLVLWVVVYLGFRLLLRVVLRLRAGAGRGQVLLIALALVAVALAMYVADRSLFVHLYRFFHIATEAVAFSALQLAVLVLAGHFRVTERRAGLILAARGGVAIVTVAAVIVTLSLWRLRDANAVPLRLVAHEHAAVGSRLLDLVRVVGLGAERTPLLGVAHGPVTPVVMPSGYRLPVRAPGADVLLITIDALRADHLGVYGYDRDTSPHIDKLARTGVVFERAYTPVPHTSFSIASLLIGKYAYSLARLGLFEGHETIADVLRRYRYKTAGFFPPAVFYVDGEQFKTYNDQHYGFEYVRFEPFLEDEDAPRRTDQVIEFLERENPDRAFVWVHYFGPHEPYVAHKKMGKSFGDSGIDLYDGEIRWVDAEVGRLIAYYRKHRPNVVVAITADHGEEFGDHGGAYHGSTLYEEQARVPLIVNAPGNIVARVKVPVSTVDVVPTLLSMVDIPVSARLRGLDRSPWMVANDELPEVSAFAEISTLRMVVSGSDKLICDVLRNYCRLYDLDVDPHERVDTSASRAQRVQEMRRLLSGWMGSHTEFERRSGGGDVVERPTLAVLERGRLGDRTAIAELLVVLANREETAVDRGRAADVLAGFADVSSKDGLRAAMQDDDALVRAWAAVGLANLEEADGVALIQGIDSPTLHGNRDLLARAALAMAAAKHASAADLLIRALTEIEEVRVRISLLRALARTKDKRAIKILRGSFGYVRTRRHSVYAMGELGDRTVVPFLLEHVVTDPYTSVRAAILGTFSKLGDRRALPAIKKAFADEAEDQVVAAAAKALVAFRQVPKRAAGTMVPRPKDAKEAWLVLDGRAPEQLPVTLQLASGTMTTVVLDGKIKRPAYSVPLSADVVKVKLPVGVHHVLFR